MQDKEYYDKIISDRDADRRRTFTYERDFSWCPGWKDKIEKCFDEVQKICHPYLMISTKQKHGYDISIIHCGSDDVYNLLLELENRTFEHCIECGKPGESRKEYGPPYCNFCFLNKK